MTKYEILKEKVNDLESDIAAIKETIVRQSGLFTDFVVMFTILLNKKVLTIEELNEEKDKLRKEKQDEKQNDND